MCAASTACKAFNYHNDNRKCFLKSVLEKGKPGNCTVGSSTPAPPSPAPASSVLLYDLGNDPFEHTDVSAAHPAVVAAMLARLAVIDQNLHAAVPNASCPKRTPGHDPVVGAVWVPWCI